MSADLDGSRVDDDNESLYVRHKDSLERCLALLEKEGLSFWTLHWYARAKAIEQDRVESIEQDDMTLEEKALYSVYDEWEGQRDAMMDEARHGIACEMDQVHEAMVAIYGE